MTHSCIGLLLGDKEIISRTGYLVDGTLNFKERKLRGTKNSSNHYILERDGKLGELLLKSSNTVLDDCLLLFDRYVVGMAYKNVFKTKEHAINHLNGIQQICAGMHIYFTYIISSRRQDLSWGIRNHLLCRTSILGS